MTAELAPADIIDLDVTGVAHGGIFVARHEGRVVFVPDTLPGERIRARVVQVKKSFARAEALEVLEAAPERREHVWAEASIDRAPENRAGGAEFGHITLKAQRRLKGEVIADQFKRVGGLEVDPIVEGVPGDDETRGTGWRTRVRLHVDDEGRVGPYAARTNRVVEVASLPLAVPEITAAAPLGGASPEIKALDLVQPSVGDVIVTPHFAPVGRDDEQPAERRITTRRGRVVRVKQDAPAASTRKAPIITELVGDREFRLAADGFWQVHEAAATMLSETVRGAIDPELFDPRAENLDLYGGVGLFAAAMADEFGPQTRVTSVEAVEQATEFAGENLQEWVGARAVTAKVEPFLDDLVANVRGASSARYSAATVVLDPPRTGAGQAVIDRLASLGVAQIVYVACDPVALARDAALLTERGYALEAMASLDLFPNTHHVECVARFVRV